MTKSKESFDAQLIAARVGEAQAFRAAARVLTAAIVADALASCSRKRLAALGAKCGLRLTDENGRVTKYGATVLSVVGAEAGEALQGRIPRPRGLA